MKISKIALLQSLIYVTAFLWFYQIGFLQLWRCIPGLANLSMGWGFAFFLVLFGLLARFLQKATCSLWDANNLSHWSLKRRTSLMGLALVLLSLAAWSLWVLPEINRPPNTFGDEDFHFQTTQTISQYIYSFWSGKPIAIAPHEAYRYGGLMYLLFSSFTLWSKSLYFSPLLQRIGLLMPFLVMSALTFVIACKLVKNTGLAFLFAMLIATSPLLLSFTMDKYLDIGHAPIFLVICAGLYLGVTQRNIAYLTICGLAAGLAPLIRENAIPTTCIIGAFLGLYGLFVFPKRIKWSMLITTAVFLPFMFFYYFKIHILSVDSDRLSLANIMHQDYKALFKLSSLYLNPILLVFSFLAFFEKSKPVQWVLAILLLSILGQLFLYAAFEPGWMPWSRNYMMFYGQILFLALMGVASMYARLPRFTWAIGCLFGMAIVFNVYLDQKELHRNTYFHEIEIRYDYSALLAFLESREKEFAHAIIYTQVPIVMPYSFQYSWDSLKSTTDKDLPFVISKIKKIGADFQFGNMMSFDEFKHLIPPQAKYFLFHWWVPNSKIGIINSVYPHVVKPNTSELSSFEVVFENQDPWSQGNAGYMLLKRREKKA